MPQVMQVGCPSCKRPLRIPADWVNQALRCKHCGALVQLKLKPPSPALKGQTAAAVKPAPVQPALGKTDPDPKLEPERQPATDSHTDLEGFTLPNTDPIFSINEASPIVRVDARYRRRRNPWVRVTGVVVFLFLAAGAAYFLREPLSRLKDNLNDLSVDKRAGADKRTSSQSHMSAAETYPRRALVICVNNYLYASPVSYGVQQHDVQALMERLRRVLHIDPTQFVELSDAARPPLAGPEDDEDITKKKGRHPKASKSQPPSVAASPARPPLKPIIEKTISDFLDSSRAQDRILLFFAGHVVESEGVPFLVPLEGDFKVKDTLIPLPWLYERLQHCKARQKVLILDTCRLDLGRGEELPGSGPLSAKLAEFLAKPPSGVQVWCACSASEYSYEVDGDSVFLSKLHEALKQRALGKAQREQDSLPIEELAETVDKATTTAVASQWKEKQTPKLSGHEAEGGAPYDKNEPLPARVTLPDPPPPAGGMAKPAETRSILNEIELPPIKLARSDTAPLRIETLVSFSAKKLQDYQPDASIQEIENHPEKYPLRVAVLAAVKLIREKFNPQSPEIALQDYFSGNNSDAIKKEILKEQEKPADVLSELDVVQRRLAKLSDARDAEPSKRWQAHYDYVLAEVEARIAYLKEYSLMLGKIRKDELPPLEPGHAGFRLASREKLRSNSEVQKLAAEAKKLMAKVARQNKGTPWEILAKRAQLTALGLEWRSTP